VVQSINALLEQLTSRTSAQINKEGLRLALKGNVRLLLAREGQRVVGMGAVCLVPRLTCRECEIHDVVVDSLSRGRGIAGVIVSLLIVEAESRFAADRINLTSSPGREAANRLYQRIGFVLRKTNYYRRYTPS
jgi:ribosomal protein S18 acetylase RimI-like enzyme